MNTSVLVALVAAVGNLIQGWDNAVVGGVIVHIKREFRWEDKPSMVGLTVALPLIGATVITMCAGGLSDWLGRRPMLTASSLVYIVSGALMLWSPNVYLLLFARLLAGCAIGLAVTFVPMYISEMAPPEVRGLLSTIPQFMYTGGLFAGNTFVFFMSLFDNASSWRLILGILFAPSIVFYAFTIFYLPESPRWLLSKCRTMEATKALQRLRGKEDVAGEMALLVEGLEVGGGTTIEEYVIGPPDMLDEEDQRAEKEEIKIMGPDGITSMVALRVSESITVSAVGAACEQGRQSSFLVDPVVSLMDSVHEKLTEPGSTLLSQLGSVFSEHGHHPRTEEWGEAASARHDEEYPSGAVSECDDSRTPLISRQGTSMGNVGNVARSFSTRSSRFGQGSRLPSVLGEGGDSTGIGGGWQLAWKWKEGDGPDGQKQGSFRRVYLHEDSAPGSWRDPADGEFIRAAALVSQSAISPQQLMRPGMVRPSAAATEGPRLSDLLEPGVKNALLVGMGIQMMQQFLGINAVLYYTPQILEQAGVQVLLSDLGMSSESASLFISAVMTLLMLPAVTIAMKLMDSSGRRGLLLTTNPVLTASLLILVMIRLVQVSDIIKAAVSTASVLFYSSFFAMGYGPIPNILCAEIFPTKVRAICMPICALTFWVCNIIVTYTLPLMLSSIGLGGCFSMYALASIISWAFVHFKVPETKGMPIEVIVDFFAIGAKARKNDDANN